MDIEELATSAVTQSISKTKNLKAYFETNGTTPSFDGFIGIFNDGNYSKKGFKRVNIQVKGTEVIKIPKNPSFSFSISDLENFKNNGGAIFFVVYVDKSEGEILGIYYNSILPFYVKEVLNNCSNKVSITLPLKAFPTNNNDKLELVLNFYDNSQKQSSFANVEIPSLEELMKSGNLETLTLSYTPVGERRDDSYLPFLMEGKEIYLYAKTKSNPILIPVQRIDALDEIVTTDTVTTNISVDGKTYYNTYKITKKRNYMAIEIGNSFIMECENPEKKEGKPIKLKLKFDVKGSLKERITDLEFMIATINNAGFYISNIPFPVKKEAFEKGGFSVETLSKQLDEYMLIQDVLKKLNVKEDLSLDKCSEEDCRRINLLLRAFAYNQPITNFKSVPPTASLFRVANIVLLLFFNKTSEGIEVYDFFNKTLDVYVNDEKGNKVEASQYYLLTKDAINECSNICYQSIIDDLKSKNKSKILFCEANDILIKLLSAYDGHPNEDLYQCIMDISNWICENSAEYFDCDIASINHLQILKRKRILTIEEKENIYDIYKNTDSTEIKIGCLLLIGDKESALNLFESLTNDIKETFITYPIWIFAEK